MIWHNLHDFLAMGGYGGYVWASFGVVFAAMALETRSVLARQRRALASAAHRDGCEVRTRDAGDA